MSDVYKLKRVGDNNNNKVYLKSNIQTRSMECTYKPIKNTIVNVQVE